MSVPPIWIYIPSDAQLSPPSFGISKSVCWYGKFVFILDLLKYFSRKMYQWCNTLKLLDFCSLIPFILNVYSLNTIEYILQFNYVHVLHQLMMNSIGYKLEITPKNCIMRKRQFSMLKRSLNPLFIQTISLTIEIHS